MDLPGTSVNKAVSERNSISDAGGRGDPGQRPRLLAHVGRKKKLAPAVARRPRFREGNDSYPEVGLCEAEFGDVSRSDARQFAGRLFAPNAHDRTILPDGSRGLRDLTVQPRQRPGQVSLRLQPSAERVP